MQRRLLLFLSVVLCSCSLVACGVPIPEEFDQPSRSPSEPESPEPKPEPKPEPEPNPEPKPEPEPNPESEPDLPAEPEASVDSELKEVLKLVNEVRASGAECGGEWFGEVGPLTLEPRLTKAAQKHSEDMFAAQTMSHDTPPGAVHYEAGSSPWDRIRSEGYNLGAGGENIARGYPDAAAVMQGWLNSPGHCRNIMGEKFTEMGLGLEENFWTQAFARPN